MRKWCRTWWSRGSTYLAICLIAGCGSGLTGPHQDRGDLEPYFQAFETYSQEQGRDTRGDDAIAMRFQTLNPNEMGRCQWSFTDGRIALFDPDKWQNLDEGSREALVMHELGHCLLNRVHTTAKLDAQDAPDPSAINQPASIMSPTCIPGGTYQQWKSYYLTELFHPD